MSDIGMAGQYIEFRESSVVRFQGRVCASWTADIDAPRAMTTRTIRTTALVLLVELLWVPSHRTHRDGDTVTVLIHPYSDASIRILPTRPERGMSV